MHPDDSQIKIQRLLKLKRHEQPPPGFFQYFPDRVISRIEAEAVLESQSWWQRLCASLDLRPVLACSYGVAMGFLLVAGIYSAPQEGSDVDAPPVVGGWARVQPAASAAPLPLASSQHFGIVRTAPEPRAELEPASAQPVFEGPPAFLLNQGLPAGIQPVRFAPVRAIR